MEDKRTAYAIFISLIIAVVWVQLAFPPPTPQPTLNNTSSTAASGMNQAPAPQIISPNQNTTSVAPSSTSRPPISAVKSAPSIIIRTPDLVAHISTLGGRVTSYQLLKYRDHIGAEDNLDMITAEEGGAYPGGLYFRSSNNSPTPESDEGISYQLSQASDLSIS